MSIAEPDRPAKIGAVVAVGLGAVLVAAAALKWADPAAGGAWVAAQAAAEACFGAWLVSGIAPLSARRAGVACFTVFAGVALHHAAEGRASCGCFGAVEVAPWATAAFDAAAVAALASTRLGNWGAASRRGLAAVAISGGVAWVILSPRSVADTLVATPPVLDLGEVPRGGVASGEIRVTNRGDSPIRLGAAKTSCPCLTVANLPGVVGPNETIALAVSLDLAAEPDFTGRLGVTLTATADDIPHPALKLRVDALVR